MEEHNFNMQPKINVAEKKSFDNCNGCTKCCEYIAMEIDTPENQSDFENIRWYLLHNNVKVIIVRNEDDDEESEDEISEEQELADDEEYEEEDSEDQWYLQFSTRCKKLSPEGICTIHNDRPEICREHSQETCEMYNDEDNGTLEFDDAETFIKWVNENYDFELEEVWEDEDGNECEADEPIETFKNEDHL